MVWLSWIEFKMAQLAYITYIASNVVFHFENPDEMETNLDHGEKRWLAVERQLVNGKQFESDHPKAIVINEYENTINLAQVHGDDKSDSQIMKLHCLCSFINTAVTCTKNIWQNHMMLSALDNLHWKQSETLGINATIAWRSWILPKCISTSWDISLLFAIFCRGFILVLRLNLKSLEK